MDYYDDFDAITGQDYENDEDYYYDSHHLPAGGEKTDEAAPLEGRFTDAFSTCIQPSLTQVFGYVATLIGWNVLWHLIVVTCAAVQQQYRREQRAGERPLERLQHYAAVLCGLALLYTAIGKDVLIVLFLCLITYVVLLLLEYTKQRNMGVLMAALTITTHFLYELLWHQPEAWQRIRGIQMVASMKIISLAFDLEADKKNSNSAPPAALPGSRNHKPVAESNDKPMNRPAPTLGPYLGYMLCPATCLLGPWLSYEQYLRSLRQWRSGGGGYLRQHALPGLAACTLNAALAMVFLCSSNCLVPLLCGERAWRWLRTYRDALAVRCSHYFICFLSQAALAAGGVTRNAAEGGARPFQWVTKPWRIEFPRSLHSLVRAWNIPMHDWLKLYVFRKIQRHAGRHRYVVALVSTYLVSSLLHGVHVRIYAVLLSLACCAYADTVLRQKLADIFDACITATPCRRPCRYTYCPSRGWRSWGVILTLTANVGFALVTICQLAYLGVMMSDSEELEIVQDDRIGWIMGDVSRVLRKWSQLDFLCHWLAIATYIFFRLI